MKIIVISGKARHGKTTVANIIKNAAIENGETAIIASYAGYVKYISSTYFGWDGNKDEHGRSILQNVGDGVRNTHGDRYWIDRLMSDIYDFCTNYNYVIVDDCRYPNEVLIPSNLFETYSIRVNRENFESDLTEEQKNNSSEVAMDNFVTDFYITACSGVENLYAPAREIYNSIVCGD